MDHTQARILNSLQREFPLVERPFAAIGECFGITEQEAISRVLALVDGGLIREISAIFDASAVGYRTALVGFEVEDGAVDSVGESVACCEMVSHCYSRAGHLNLWFTLAAQSEDKIDAEVARIALADGVKSHAILPAVRTFKQQVFLDMNDVSVPSRSAPVHRIASGAEMSEKECLVCRALQSDLPVVERPFAVLARENGLRERELLGVARVLVERGVIRRYAAVLRHVAAGYSANAMVCWEVDIDAIEETGRLFACEQAVSHCYERPDFPGWPYRLYTMIHARSEDRLEAVIASLAAAPGVISHRVLPTLREFKKSRVRYFR